MIAIGPVFVVEFETFQRGFSATGAKEVKRHLENEKVFARLLKMCFIRCPCLFDIC